MSTLRTIFKKAWPVTIRGQLIVGIVLVHLLLMSIFVSNLVIRQRNFLRKQAHDQALGFAKNYAANASAFVIANDFDALERLTLSQNNLSNLKYAMILSLQGVVLAHTDYNLIGKRPTDKVSLQLPG